MARVAVTPHAWEVDIPVDLMSELEGHLFPGDGDEHGAVLLAGVAETRRGTRLLIREVLRARDGIDYVPGKRGYRMLTAAFVTKAITKSAADRCAYLAVHCHPGNDAVRFSEDDLASHERGYPALLDLAEGRPVGALVFARNAAAGDIWTADGARRDLSVLRVVGRPMRYLFPLSPTYTGADSAYDRQARLFGDRGQALLAGQKVGVLGAGGAGSLIVQYLARLGVGHIVVVDPERIDLSNVPRVIGSRRRDARPWLTARGRPEWIQQLGRVLSKKKTAVAARVAREANRHIRVDSVEGDVADGHVARRLIDCDHLFLAADTMRARLVFNAIVHQYLIPGTQVGAKVTVDSSTGDIVDVFSVSRPVLPHSGCLWCNGLISSARLQEEALTASERREQQYVAETTIVAPSVITLNAVACAHAVDDYLFSVTGMLKPGSTDGYRRFVPRDADFFVDEPRRDPFCSECGRGASARGARGDGHPLPTR